MCLLPYLSADVLYDLGTGLEVMSPLCPHLFLQMAGLGNFAKVFSSLCLPDSLISESYIHRGLSQFDSLIMLIFVI